MEDTKNDSMQDIEAPASREARSPPNKTRSIIANLDATIASFGDGHITSKVTRGFPSTDETLTGTECDEQQQTSLDGDAGILKKFAPPGLEDPFRQLHSILFPALYRASKGNAGPAGTPSTPGSSSSSFRNPVSSSSAAILMGVRGSGKTLLLERVLEACREQLQGSSSNHNDDGGRRPCILYRLVEINGIVCRGEDVASVVYEIIRQLSGIAYRSMQINKCEESPAKSKPNRNRTRETGSGADGPEKIKQPPGSMGARTDGDDDDDDDDDERATGKRKHASIGGDENATADGDHRSAVAREPDETTTKAGERQRRKQRRIDKRMLRLRRATFNSNLALLESTLELAAADDIPILLTLDELDSFTSDEGERQMLLYHFLDRVATPGSNLILVGMTSSFSALTLLEKRIRSRAEGTAKIIYLRAPQSYPDLLRVLECKLNGCVAAGDVLDRLAHPNDAESNASKIVSEHASDRNERIDAIVKLSVAMEREFRLGRDIRWFSRVISTALSLYRHDCILAAAAGGARNGGIDAADSVPPGFDTKHLWDAMVMMGASISDATVASRQPDLCLVNDAAVSPRLQALLDLSTPQVALLLSARRILKREEHRDQAVLAPLTTERMLKEYESFRRGSRSTGNSKLLKRAACQLMQQGLLVPSIDHSGGGPLQYSVSKVYRTLDPYALSRLPLHLPFDIDRELGKALEQNLLECPTSLKEWGK